MSKLTRLEEVALAILIATKNENTLNSCFKEAQEFLECSEGQFKNCDFNKPDINGIEVVGHVEVKNYGINSQVISSVDIMNCLTLTEKQLHEKQVLSPVYAMKIVSTNLANMASRKVKEANDKQFNG